MRRLCLATLLSAALFALAGCAHEYTDPKPTQPFMPPTVTWGTAQPSQEQK